MFHVLFIVKNNSNSTSVNNIIILDFINKGQSLLLELVLGIKLDPNSPFKIHPKIILIQISNYLHIFILLMLDFVFHLIEVFRN